MSHGYRQYPYESCLTLILSVAFGIISVVIADEIRGYDSLAGANMPVFSEWLDTCRDETRCLSVEPRYCGEFFDNAHGGITTKGAAKYLGLLEIPLTLDLEKLQTPLPGRVYLLGQTTHGQGISEDFVGDAQLLSNIDSLTDIAQISEYWWEFGLLEDDVTIRLGKQDLNTEFLLIDLASDYIHSTFGMSPSTAFPTYPAPSMGAVALVQLTASWQLKTGIWDAFASGGSWGFSGNNSVLAVGELEHSYSFAEGEFPGVVAFGAVYESSGQIDGIPISAVQEYYVQFEQWLVRESHSNDEDMRGLGVFAGYYPRIPGPIKAAASFGDNLVAGMMYRGLFPWREEDVLGVGVSWTELYGGGSGQETACELFYKFQLTPRISLQPDMQYIATPSGVERDSLVVGLRFQAVL